MFGVLHWGTGSVAIETVSIMERLVPKRHGEGDRFLLWKIRLYSECSFEVLGACRLLPLFRRVLIRPVPPFGNAMLEGRKRTCFLAPLEAPW